MSAANVVVRFKLGRGSQKGATILHPNTKVLDFQGLFVFFRGEKQPLSPLHLFLNLLVSNLRLICHALSDKIPRKVGRHLVQIMV